MSMRRLTSPLLPLLLLALSPAIALAAAAEGGAVTETLPTWATGTGFVIGMLGGPVFAVWYAWYITTNRIPAIEKGHVDQMAEVRRQAAEQMTEARRQYSDHLTLLIANFRQDIQTIWNAKREDENRIAVLRREDDNKLVNALERLIERIDENGCKYIIGGSPRA